MTPLAIAGGIGTLASAAAAWSLMQTGRTPTINPEHIWTGHPHRWAVVWAVGGVSGTIWQTGITGWLEHHGIRLRDAPLAIGTSAGSLTAILGRTRLGTDELTRLAADGQLTIDGSTIALPEIVEIDETDPTAWDPRWRRRDSLAGPWRALSEHHIPSLAPTLAGLLPTGHFSLDEMADTIDHTWRQHGTGQTWPDNTWIVTVDLHNGQRTVFGAAGEPETSCGLAVAASCAVPGVLKPVTINQRRYIDGGVASFTNIDLAIAAGAEHITVVNPVATIRRNINPGPVGWAESVLRRAQTRAMDKAVAGARKLGIHVDVIAPTQDELDAMGDRLLDFTRASDILDAVNQRSSDLAADLTARLGETSA